MLRLHHGTLLFVTLALAAVGAEPRDPALLPVTPEPGLFPGSPELWEQEHQANLRLVAQRRGPVDVLLLGDSLTAQWGNGPVDSNPEHAAVWKRFFGAKTVINLGLGGDKTQNVLWRIEHGEVEGLEPRVVVLAVGVNNLFNLAVPPPAVAAGVAQCADALQARLPRAEIVVVNLFPHEESPASPGRRRGEAARAAIATLGLDRRPRLHLLDLAGGFLQPDGALQAALFAPDHLHLTTAGYEVYAQGLAPLVAKLLGP